MKSLTVGLILPAGDPNEMNQNLKSNESGPPIESNKDKPEPPKNKNVCSHIKEMQLKARNIIEHRYFS